MYWLNHFTCISGSFIHHHDVWRVVWRAPTNTPAAKTQRTSGAVVRTTASLQQGAGRDSCCGGSVPQSKTKVTGGCPSDRLVTRGNVLFSVQTSEFNPPCLHIYPQSHLHVQAFTGIFHPFPGAVGSNDIPHNAKCDYCHEAPAEEMRRQTLLHTT